MRAWSPGAAPGRLIRHWEELQGRAGQGRSREKAGKMTTVQNLRRCSTGIALRASALKFAP